MDAGIQAMDGNLMVWHLPDLTTAQADRLPSLDAGLAHHIPVVRASPRTPCVQIRSRRICRHPCRNDELASKLANVMALTGTVGTINLEYHQSR